MSETSAAARRERLISADQYGVPAFSAFPHAVSGNGRFVVFEAAFRSSDRLSWQLYRKDLRTGRLDVITPGPGNEQLGTAGCAAISWSGDLVVFGGRTLEPETGARHDLFLWNARTGRVHGLLERLTGTRANGPVGIVYVTMSDDGSVIGFLSDATNLSPADKGRVTTDLLILDRRQGRLLQVNINPAGERFSSDYFGGARLSGDGRWLVFETMDGSLVPGDTNDAVDVFLYEVETGRTTRSVSDRHPFQGGFSGQISGDGRWIYFQDFGLFAHDRVTQDTIEARVRPRWFRMAREAVSYDGRFVCVTTPDIELYDRVTQRQRVVWKQTPARQLRWTELLSKDGSTVVFTAWCGPLSGLQVYAVPTGR